jgi:large subunit ribosomal protein L25
MELKATKRDILGGKTRNLRKQGLVPAELYGREAENLHLSVSEKDFRRVFAEAGESTIIDLEVDGEIYPVLVNDFQKDPISRNFISVDFYRVRMDEKISAPVDIEIVGEAPAVKEKGGMLVRAMEEAEVEALPANLPHKLIVDVSGLTEIGQSVFVKDIQTKGNFRILVSPETVIATVSEIPEEEEAASVSVENVVVEGEEKRAEKKSEEALKENEAKA